MSLKEVDAHMWGSLEAFWTSVEEEPARVGTPEKHEGELEPDHVTAVLWRRDEMWMTEEPAPRK